MTHKHATGLMIASVLFLFSCPFSTAVWPVIDSSTATPPAVIETPVGLNPDDRWIEIDIQAQQVRLHDGGQVIGEFEAATGVGSTPQTTTYTGLFEVEEKIKGPLENVPGVFLTDVVIFDWTHGNGIHSVPMDKDGNILDDRLGQPLTAGCIRVAHSAVVFDFAQPGMKVWVH